MLIQSNPPKSYSFSHALYDAAKTVVMTGAAEVALRAMQQPGIAEIGIGASSFLQGSFWLLKSAVCAKAPMKSSKTIAAMGAALMATGLGLMYTGVKKCVVPAVTPSDPIQRRLSHISVMVILIV